MIQLDLFEDDQKVLILEELRKVKESADSVRKGVFARIKELENQIKEMKQQKGKLEL